MEHYHLDKKEKLTSPAKNDCETWVRGFESNPESTFWIKNLPEKIENGDDVRAILAKAGSFFRPFLMQAFSEKDPNGDNTRTRLNGLIEGCGVTISGIRKYTGKMTAGQIIGNNKQDILLEVDLTDDDTSETRTVIGA